MKAARTFLFVAIAVGLPSGCGTVLNLSTQTPDIYGGVQKDVEFVLTPRHDQPAVSVGAVTLLWLVAADTGMSLVADTLTLPLVVYLKQHGEASVDGGTVCPADKQVAKGAVPKPVDKVELTSPNTSQ
jgi:uncharacterized protein YceK